METDRGRIGPRERLLELGEQALSLDELLALILGTGTRDASVFDVARTIAGRGAGLRALAQRRTAEWLAIPGVGPAQAGRLSATFELARRLAAEPPSRGRPIKAGADVNSLLGPRLRDQSKEQFVALLLDARHRLLREERVSIGTLTGSLVHPREVFRPAIRESAVAIIVAHNHPSGDPTPSREDIEVTDRLAQVGRLVGISLLDHVIVGDDDYVSLREAGYMAADG